MRDVDKVKMMNQELRIRRDQEKRTSASNLFNMGLQNLSSGISDLEGMGMQMAGMAMTGGLSGLGGGASAKSSRGLGYGAAPAGTTLGANADGTLSSFAPGFGPSNYLSYD